MSEDLHKWSDGRYTLMFDEHTFFVFDNEEEKRMTALQVTEKLNEQQVIIDRLQRYNDVLHDENFFNTMKMFEFMKEKGVFDEFYERIKKEVLNDE